ncbi:hypothetical protein ACFSTC_11710 [Nonomuraea ferruginea]
MTAVVAVVVALLVQFVLVNRLRLLGRGSARPGAAGGRGGAALARGPAAGAVLGFGAGLLVDLAPPTAHVAGLYAFVFALVGYLAGRGVGNKVVTVVLCVLLAPLLAAAVSGLLSDPRVTVSTLTQQVPVTVACTLIVAPRGGLAGFAWRAGEAPAVNRMRTRLLVVQVLVLVLLAALAVRLWQVQVVRGPEFVNRATETRTRTVIVPAVRGQILDSSGRPLVRNKSRLVVSVDRNRLVRMRDSGVKVLGKLSEVLSQPVSQLQRRITPCGPDVPKPCWTGSPYQPVPLGEKVDTREALQILEQQEKFPAVSAEIQAIREYPLGEAGAQMFGYLSPVTEAELEKRVGLKATFSGVDLAGRDGLEYFYDEELRGKAEHPQGAGRPDGQAARGGEGGAVRRLATTW